MCLRIKLNDSAFDRSQQHLFMYLNTGTYVYEIILLQTMKKAWYAYRF